MIFPTTGHRVYSFGKRNKDAKKMYIDMFGDLTKKKIYYHTPHFLLFHKYEQINCRELSEVKNK